MLTEEQRNLIDKYIIGQLSEEEQNKFDSFQTDPDFQKELQLQSDMQLAVKLHQRDLFLKKLSALEDGKAAIPIHEKETPAPEKQTEKGKVIPLRRILSIAAAILVIAVTSFFLLNRTAEQAPYLALFEDNFDLYPNIVDPTTQSKTANKDALIEALNEYDQEGKQAQATQLFSTLSNPTDTVKFYLANLWLQQGIEIDKAIGYFSALSNAPSESIFTKPATLYLALAYLRQGEIAAAEREVDRILADNSYNETLRAKAQNLKQGILTLENQ